MELIDKIKHLPNNVQVDILLDFLFEIGGNAATTRNQYMLYWCDQMIEAYHVHTRNAQLIKCRIKELLKTV